MTVYVDNYKASYGRMIMCHMVADSEAELHAMADKIGVARKHFQRKLAMPWRDHYDICLAKRRLAIEHGAVEVSMNELGRIMRRKKLEAQYAR